MFPDERALELYDLVAQGQEALAAPPLARVSKALLVLPALVEALDDLCHTEHQLRHLRLELTAASHGFREAVWASMRVHPEITYKNADVQRQLERILGVIDRLDELLRPTFKPPADEPSLGDR